MLANWRNRRWLVTTGVIAVLGMFAAADVALSQPPDSRGRFGRMMRGLGGPSGGMGLPLHRLDLTEGQRTQVRHVLDQNRAATREAEGRVHAARGALSDAVNAEVLNEGAIHAVASELGLAEGEAAIQRAHVRFQLWQLLTPDQQAVALKAQATLKERQDQRRERMRERRGRRRGMDQ